jgi:hypothetical protein
MVCLLSVSSDVPQCWHCLQGTRLIPSALECLRPALSRKELLAAVYFTKYFRHYLLGRKFVIRSDHSSLRLLLNFKEPEGQMARWLQILCSFDMEIQYRAGRKHSNADGMSRVPCKQCQHCGTSEDKDSKHTIHTAVSPLYCISISKEQRIWSHLAICPSSSLKLRSQRSELWSLLMTNFLPSK